MNSNIKKIFALDIRSLALLRIGLGLILLYDLFHRFSDLKAHYSDAGALPRLEFLFKPGAWSFHYLNGEPWFQGVLLGIMVGLAVLFLIGYHTRFVTILMWMFVVSLHHRNFMILSFADDILRILLFWACFLPLGAAFSLDRLRSDQKNIPKTISSIASAGLILQICTIYLATAALKSHPAWISEFTALEYAFHFDFLARPFAGYLLQYPGFLKFLTFIAITLEWTMPLIILIPFKNTHLRLTAIGCMLAFHLLGIQTTLAVGLFGFVCAFMWLALLPTSFWEWLKPKKCYQKLKNSISTLFQKIPLPLASESVCLKNPKLVECIAGIFIFLMFYTSINVVTYNQCRFTLPQSSHPALTALGFRQEWRMFTPAPSDRDGWFVFEATLSDGSIINLLHPDDKLTWKKPQFVYKEYPNLRWQKFFVRMGIFAKSHYHSQPYFYRYFYNEWNKKHPERTIVSMDANFILEKTMLDGYYKPRKFLYWSYPVNNKTNHNRELKRFYKTHPDYQVKESI